MIFIILLVYWIFSTLCLGLSILSEEDNFEYGIVVGCISVFFGWLILPAACIYHVYKILKKKFYENK
jgi:hypothetical protein